MNEVMIELVFELMAESQMGLFTTFGRVDNAETW